MVKNYLLKTGLVFLLFFVVTDYQILNQKSAAGKTSPGVQFCPAYPGLIKAQNPDGSIISFFLKGDEYLSWRTSTNGYTLLENDKGYICYAKKDASGDLVPSDIIATDYDNKATIPFEPNLFYSTNQLNVVQKARIEDNKLFGSQEVFPPTGTRNVLMILMGFPDLPFQKTKTDFENLMNQTNYGGYGSFKDYFKDMSMNNLNLETTVSGIFITSSTMAKYGAQVGTSKYPNPKLFVQEAVDQAEANGIDFSKFDNDGDGIVDGVIVVHAGYGEEAGASMNTIWSHKSSLGAFARTYDGVTVNEYNIVPELTGNSGSTLTPIGVICHEFGHLLGLPDYYDTDYATNGQAYDLYNWELMSGGSYNNNSRSPAGMSALSRYLIGWLSLTELTAPQTGVTLENLYTSNKAYKISTPQTGEYFILENRQNSGFDTYIPGHGLLIYHIDENWILTHPGRINAYSTHQGVDIEEADGTQASTSSFSDTYPNGATSFTDKSTPNMITWTGFPSTSPVSNIAENISTGVVTFNFKDPASQINDEVACMEIIEPVSGCSKTSTENVKIKIKNFGKNTITAASNLKLYYTINSGTPVEETYTGSDIVSGQEIEYSFTAKANLSAKNTFGFKAYSKLTTDQFATNDTAFKMVLNPDVISIPVSENFEGTFPPTKWSVYNPDAPSIYKWEQIAATGNGVSTKAASMQNWNYADKGQIDALITPNIDLSSTTNAKLTFNVAYHVTWEDELRVYVSTDCGLNYTKVYEKAGYDLATTTTSGDYGAGNENIGFIPNDAKYWRNEYIDLTPYCGNNVIIMFEATNQFGDNLYIDDVFVEQSCTPPSVQASALIATPSTTNIQLDFTRGNGDKVLVLVKEDGPVDIIPVENTAYNANAAFSLGDEIGTGNFVVLADNASTVTITGLSQGTSYYFAVFEYNSATNCYKYPALTGDATTLLDAPEVKFISVRNLQPTSIDANAELVSAGNGTVSEMGFVLTTEYKLPTTDDLKIPVTGTSIGSFSKSIAALSPNSFYYIRAYAISEKGTGYSNNYAYFWTLGGCDDLNYLPAGFSKVAGTYTDISTTTGSTVISTPNTNDASSSALDIGFNFTFNCVTFNKFVLNTNGFIVLGDKGPSRADLFPTKAAPHNSDGIFVSQDLKDINIISAYNYDLIGATGAEFRAVTTGSAPNRITTIQFKNMKDAATTPQFNTMNFQIKLYETSNIIELVYGSFTTTSNTATAQIAQVGLKGYSGQGTLSSFNTQILGVKKGSTTQWTSATSATGSYTYNSATSGFVVSRTAFPASGQTYRFTPKAVVSINPVEEDNFNIYPNPASDFVIINNNDNKMLKVDIIDITGKKVASTKNNTSTIRMDIGDLSKGVYLIKIYTKEAIVDVQKIIVE